MITTRRLVHISNAYKIFNMDRVKAISMCVNRFDDETKNAMLDLYTKVDADATAVADEADADTSDSTVTEGVGNECPF